HPPVLGAAGLRLDLSRALEPDLTAQAQPRPRPGPLPTRAARLRPDPRDAGPDRHRTPPAPDGLGLRPAHGLRGDRAPGLRCVVPARPPRPGAPRGHPGAG